MGYVDNVHELMAAADVLISKPGGLSMTEAIQVGLPVVVIDPLAGQETKNTQRLSNAGCVRVVSKDEGIIAAIEDLLGSGGRPVREAMAKFRKKGAALAIAREVLDSAARQEQKR